MHRQAGFVGYNSAMSASTASTDASRPISLLAFVVGLFSGMVVGSVVTFLVLGLAHFAVDAVGIRASSFASLTISAVVTIALFIAFLVWAWQRFRSIERIKMFNMRFGLVAGLAIALALCSGKCFLMAVAVWSFGPSGVTMPSLERSKEAHQKLEGNSRGYWFEQVALTLMSMDSPFTEAEVIQHLGIPDRVKEEKNRRRFVYFYDRFATKDWAVYVDLDRSDGIASFGFNDAKVNDHSSWTPYVPK
jgi:hypothetical protein